MTCLTALLTFAAFESEIWETERRAGEHAEPWGRECGLWIWYLQLHKQLLKQHVKATVFNVTESAEDTGFIVVLFWHVFLCVVSARKYQQDQNNLSSNRDRQKFRGLQTFLCRQTNLPLPTLEDIPPIILLFVACRGRSKAFCFGPLPKIPAVVNICNQYGLIVSVLLAFLLEVFKSILVAGGEMGRGEEGECLPWGGLPALLPDAAQLCLMLPDTAWCCLMLPSIAQHCPVLPHRTFSGRQAAPSTGDATAPRPLPH